MKTSLIEAKTMYICFTCLYKEVLFLRLATICSVITQLTRTVLQQTDAPCLFKAFTKFGYYWVISKKKIHYIK